MLIAQIFDNIDWQVSVGDPTAMGWAIVVAYGVAEWLCVLNYRRRTSLIDQPRQRRLGQYWFMLSLGMLVMGFNKQLDFQALMHEVGREIVRENGWFSHRRGIKIIFIAGLMVVLLSLMACFITLMKILSDRVLISALGVCVLIAFVLYRAVAIYIEHLPLGGVVVPGVKVNHLFELAGIALIIGGARLNLKRVKTHRLTRQSPTDLTD